MSRSRYNLSNNYHVRPSSTGSKYLRTDGPPRASVPYLTSNRIPDLGTNKIATRTVNSSTRTTVHTRTRDQNYINVDQFAFLDTRSIEAPVLLNLQTLNWMLASVNGELGELLSDPSNKAFDPYRMGAHVTAGKGRARGGGGGPETDLFQDDAEKAYIMDKFKLYGVVVERDTDTNMSLKHQRGRRAITCTVQSVCNTMDYFSFRHHPLKGYGSCFFVLKKVRVKAGMKWENSLSGKGTPEYLNARTIGRHVVDQPLKWQIVPYHTSDSNTLPVDKRVWVDDNGHKRIGGMWTLGKVHHNPDLPGKQYVDKREDETATARDISLVHNFGHTPSIMFFLNISESR